MTTWSIKMLFCRNYKPYIEEGETEKKCKHLYYAIAFLILTHGNELWMLMMNQADIGRPRRSRNMLDAGSRDIH